MISEREHDILIHMSKDELIRRLLEVERQRDAAVDRLDVLSRRLNTPIAELVDVADVERERDRLQAILQTILAEPYGCPFCDSGKLRNPDKGHAPDCPYALARAALKGTNDERT